MYAFITVLIIIACILLIIVVLIQNPKGGGLSQAFGGVSSQFFGVRQTTDFIEKSTWGLIIIIGGFCLLTSLVKPKLEETQATPQSHLEQVLGKGQPMLPSQPMTQPQQQQAQPTAQPQQPAQPTHKKKGG